MTGTNCSIVARALKSIAVSVVIALATVCCTQAQAGNNSGQAFAIWPDSGQTTCYDDDGDILDPCPSPGQPFYGQDAQYAGPDRSYTKLDASGKALPGSAASWTMIRDNVTGLIWESKVDGDGVQNYANPNDADNTYTWCDTNPDTNGGDQGSCSDNNTEDFISFLNGSVFGGHTDWRVPTIKELITLVDRGRFDPSISTTFFPLTAPSPYWSSSTFSGDNPSIVRVVYFSNGDEYQGVKAASYHVRAVRGGEVRPEDRFVDNLDGTVTDTLTCLQWEQASADNTGDGIPDYLNWQEALAYAEDLVLAGHDDWRLPDVNELRSIVDYSRYPLLINPTFFPDAISIEYWTSTTEPANPDRAFLVPFYNEYDGDGTKTYHYRVHAVRGGQCSVADSSAFPWEIFLPAILHGRKK